MESKNGKIRRRTASACMGRFKSNAVDGLTFWSGFCSDSPLSLVYKAIQSVQITAASTERNWSKRAAIHTKTRIRLDVEMAAKLTFIKHNLMLEHKDLFKKSRRENRSEEQKSEEEQEVDEENNVFDSNDDFEFLFEDD